MLDSDSLYHRLFADPRMVEGLVREFVPQRLVADLDYSRLRRVNTKFHPGRSSARRREGDVIWKLPIREGSDIHLYLMIEFQSKSDAWMAVRTQAYQGLLWQQVIDEYSLKGGALLPPLLMLVLYNGQRRWKVATTTSELIALSSDSPLWPEQPRVRYHLLDVGAFSNDELAKRSSLAALLFRLEQSSSCEGLGKVFDEVKSWFRRHEGYERLRALFDKVVRQACEARGLKLPESVNLWEGESVLADQIGVWMDRQFAEGEARGEAKGKAEALILILAQRFGAVATSRQVEIREAKLESLDCWIKRVVVAPDLASVFDPPH
jgi:hypothetical protein